MHTFMPVRRARGREMDDARRRAATAAVAAAVGLIASGIARIFSDGLALSTDDAQWSLVRRHEERFVQALRANSAAEGDDSSI